MLKGRWSDMASETLLVEFWLGGDQRFSYEVPIAKVDECLALPKGEDRFAYWREVTGDPRIKGNILIWTFERAVI
jgi:hypothetical protein